MGGEKFDALPLEIRNKGSPPHGRGKAYEKIQSYRDEGITPAWAGKSVHPLLAECRHGDHPRMGGEKMRH